MGFFNCTVNVIHLKNIIHLLFSIQKKYQWELTPTVPVQRGITQSRKEGEGNKKQTRGSQEPELPTWSNFAFQRQLI